ncbi:MAG: PEP-CTERM sorting domain-containing protein [Planctomycetota bacterium]
MKKQMTLAALVAAACMTVRADAGDVSLIGVANGDSRWYEYFSDAYAQLDFDPDGFYSISTEDQATDPFPGQAGIIPGSNPLQRYGAATVFKNGPIIDLGTLSYDSSGLTGNGNEDAAITGLVFDLAPSVAGGDANVPFGGTYTTTVQTAAGTVSLLNGNVVNINLTSDFFFTYQFVNQVDFSLFPLDYNGVLTITDNDFTLVADQPAPGVYEDFQGSGFNLRYEWDISGVVPEPGSLSLLALGGLALVRRRRM